jgi:nicotinate-nucleotide adenylyltransferase
MRVALFGGSFNPPHVGHQLVALYVLETAAVDGLWLLPAFQHPFEKPLAPFADRLRMCQLAAAALGPRVTVSDVEARLGGASRTLRTVEALISAHPEHSFSLVIGSDLKREVGSWYGSAELAQLVPFVVVGRAGGEPSASPESSPPRVAMPAVSSTEIRTALASGGDVADLVPKGVLDYIRQTGLYGAR